jgi:hypothetical protein
MQPSGQFGAPGQNEGPLLGVRRINCVNLSLNRYHVVRANSLHLGLMFGSKRRRQVGSELKNRSLQCLEC